jgi:hypothetical protein
MVLTKIVGYIQTAQNGSTIIDEYEEATFQVEIENEMVLVPSKPSHLIGIIGQPLEDCTSKTSMRHAIKSV